MNLAEFVLGAAGHEACVGLQSQLPSRLVAPDGVELRKIDGLRIKTRDALYAQNVLSQIDAGKWPQAANAPGTKRGRPFENDGDPLPTTDASGRPIIYQEWDVNPKVPGQARDEERIVTGSDGSAWYTTDHYGTFHRIR